MKSEPIQLQLRDPMELVYAHDLLASIILGETPVQLDKETIIRLSCACDVLCWVLKHDHNKHFASNIQKLEALLKECGGEMVRK